MINTRENLEIIIQLIKVIHEGFYILLGNPTRAKGKIERGGSCKIILNTCSIATRAFLIIEIKIIECVKNIIGGPNGAYPPIDALSAKDNIPFTAQVFSACTVNGAI